MKPTNTEPKRVCTIHDLSAFGRCALTVVIPTLSALGIQSVPLPTALMSTHTGGYSDIYIRDLSEDMRAMAEHWRVLGVSFDAIYSGFILNASQGHIIEDIIGQFRKDGTLVLIDPVMGDDGELYSTCTRELASVMRSLCLHADLITPNLTEACILTDTPYPKATFDSYGQACGFCSQLLQKLASLCKTAAVTGIEYRCGENIRLLTACTDSGCVRFFDQPKIGASYPGTGELFASVLLGQILDGAEFFSAAEFSGRFVADTIALSEGCISQKRHGTALEPALMALAHDTYQRLHKQPSER